MRNCILLLIYLLINCTYAQNQNEVVNPGFELDASGNLATGYSGTCPDELVSVAQPYWDEVLNWSIPLANCNKVGSADCQSGQTRSGNRYGSLIYHSKGWGGGGNKEYIVGELKSSMIENHVYYVEFYAKGISEHINNSNENFGLRLFEDQPEQCTFYRRIRPDKHDKAQIAPDFDLQNNNTNQYRKYVTYYTSNKPYNYVVLGFFGDYAGDPKDGVNELDIDDIRIFDLGLDNCSDGDWLFQNTDLYNHVYSSNEKIIAGEDISQEFYNGEVLIKSNNAVWFRAGTQVVLEPGFSTEDGAYFETLIDPSCTPFNPCQNVKPPNQSYVSCNGDNVILGPALAEDYMQYSWSPTTYLDDPTIANPTFTPPPTGDGNIEYTLTMTPLCGGFFDGSTFPPTFESTANITYNVQYYNNPDPNPSFTVNSFNTDKCHADFNLTLNPYTKTVNVQVTDIQTGAIWFATTYNVNPNNCCNYSWNSSTNIPDIVWNNFESCHDYNIKIKTNNWCNENVYSKQSLIWNQEENYQLLTPLGNTITPIGSPGSNDWFKLDATGVNRTILYVYNRWGYKVYQSSFDGYCQNTQSGKLWSGQCNSNLCSQSCLNEGWYNYVLFVYPCNGGLIDYAGQIYLDLDGNNSNNTYCNNLIQKASNTENIKPDPELDSLAYQIMLTNNPDLLEQENITKNEFELYPNPNNGKFRMTVNEEVFEKINSYQIYDFSGRVVFEKSANISREELVDINLSSGIYTFVLHFDDGNKTKRFVIE